MPRDERTPEARIRAAWEHDHVAPSGADERFLGFGLMGLPLASGHVLALRHFPKSSIGPGYTAVWHREPSGAWRFYSDAPARQSCARYFGAALEAAEQRHIRVEWTTPWDLEIRVPEVELTWRLQFEATIATSVFNAVGSLLPESWWWQPRVLAILGAVAGSVLHLGRVKLQGHVPNGQRYRASPRALWMVRASTATWRGRDLGPPAAHAPQSRLGEFWVPQRGVLAIGAARFDRYDPARHTDVVAIRPVGSDGAPPRVGTVSEEVTQG